MNYRPPTPPIKPIIDFDSFELEELPKTSDGLFFRVRKIIWPKLPRKSTEELAASAEIKYLQEAVKNGQELEVRINRPEEIICFSKNVYPNDPKNLSLFE